MASSHTHLPTPLIITPDEDPDIPTFNLPDEDEPTSDSNFLNVTAAPPSQFTGLLEPARPTSGAFLSPSLQPPSPGIYSPYRSNMGADDYGREATPPPPANPFNFQTQIISTSPVKSVGHTVFLSALVSQRPREGF
jgi:hypothetical protein